MRRALLLHLVFMALGYALAVLVSLFAILMVMAIANPSYEFGDGISLQEFRRDLPMVFFAGVYFSITYSFPGWLISVIIAEARREQRWPWFAAAGVFIALLALFISGAWSMASAHPLYFSGVLIGWFFGGLVYWSIAGRNSGGWRPSPAAQSDSAMGSKA